MIQLLKTKFSSGMTIFGLSFDFIFFQHVLFMFITGIFSIFRVFFMLTDLIPNTSNSF